MSEQFGANKVAGPAGIIPTNLVQDSSVYLSTNFGTSNAFAQQSPLVKVSAPAGTSGVLQTVLSATGKGALQFLSMANYDTNPRTLRMKVTIDGVVVFDRTTGSTSVTTTHYPVVGSVALMPGSDASQVFVYAFEQMLFEKSLLIEFASNVTDANSARVAYRVVGR